MGVAGCATDDIIWIPEKPEQYYCGLGWKRVVSNNLTL
jgi:hypothetical protein